MEMHINNVVDLNYTMIYIQASIFNLRDLIIEIKGIQAKMNKFEMLCQ